MRSLVLTACAIPKSLATTESLFTTLRSLSSMLAPVSPSGCARFPLLEQLRGILAKPSMEAFTAAMGGTAIGVSHAIHASEENEEMRRECPLGVATAEIYLAVAQEKEWKYKLLHKGLYALLNGGGSGPSWPVNVELVDKLYRNSESSGKPNVKLTEQKDSVLFYNWYLGNQCECTTRSWCQPFFLQKELGIFLAARDEAKTIYKMDTRGCFQSIGYGLTDVYLDHEFAKIFVFEVNAFMHPELRALRRKSDILFPMYTLSDQQMSSFTNTTAVIADDTYFKPPAPTLTRTLTVEYRKAVGKSRQRRLVVPARVWSPKQQLELLKKIGHSLEQLDLNVVFLGECGTPGNLTYCHEFDRAVSKHSPRAQWLESVSDAELANFYATSLGIFLFSLNDCNPRVLYEALWTDTPFLVSSGVVVPEKIRKFGRVFQAEDHVVDTLELFLTEATSRRKWKVGELRAFAEEFINEEVVYSELFARLNVHTDLRDEL